MLFPLSPFLCICQCGSLYPTRISFHSKIPRKS
jgi:hypothetical protein